MKIRGNREASADFLCKYKAAIYSDIFSQRQEAALQSFVYEI